MVLLKVEVCNCLIVFGGESQKNVNSKNCIKGDGLPGEMVRALLRKPFKLRQHLLHVALN